MGVRSESEGEIQFSFLNLFTRALRESTVPSLYIQEQLPRLFRRSLSTEVGFREKLRF